MTIEQTYKCDLCGDPVNPSPDAGSRRAIGIYWVSAGFRPRGWVTKPAREVEHHLCPACVSSIQSMPADCGQGYECNNGSSCGSDHK